MKCLLVLLGGAALIAGCGCGVRAPQTYRLTDHLLIPPGVASADAGRRTILVDVPSHPRRCDAGDSGIELARHGIFTRVTLSRDALAKRPRGWLAGWTTSLESAGCIAPGDGLKLGARIAQSVPLDPAAAYHLMHADDRRAYFLDLGPENRLQVDSPILSDETAPAIESTKTNGLTVEVRTTLNLLGYETAWYAIRPKPAARGFSIVPLSAESHIQGKVERTTEPRKNYFQFNAAAAFYRIFYRGDQTIILVSAPDRAALDDETRALQSDSAACATFPAGTCVLVPNKVGVNATIVVSVNGREIPLPVGSTARNAIRAAGEQRAENVLATLTIRKLYGSTVVPVEFDAANAEILNLVLLGGEEISW